MPELFGAGCARLLLLGLAGLLGPAPCSLHVGALGLNYGAEVMAGLLLPRLLAPLNLPEILGFRQHGVGGD